MPTEKDGDFHMRVRLDRQFQNLINQKNIDIQGGNLVVEPMCINRVSQPSAMGVCRRWRQNVTIPAIGDRVVITGDYVLDSEGGHGWTEIHPVSIIRIIRRTPRRR